MAICCSLSPKSFLASLPPRGRGRGGGRAVPSRIFWKAPELVVRAAMVDSSESSASFARRMERAWLISQQPQPIACSSCESNGYIECKWCRGTGFFILGNNMLCEVPSRNTTCVICDGKGSVCCPDCKGTGFRARWLGEPPCQK
ncbi:uncharacterized protein [Elaeis guineensis]|uniref:Protein PHOTOSYSTEM I ASSEMBLY 2, chloroplastic isoform X1 n=1 Tax=Elaeis guineensis var. tenera TaxID=51953 RepID=A0A6J0PLC7_ELAGV|nr:protein PHOTOSYSTEM I ASSEMBLY 2, chloroplastic isoform X1 [Elaeis guineensis]